MTDRHQLELAITAQEALRGTVPDEIVDAAVDALRRQLDAIDGATRRRRQVTVLFADVSGFTAMSERMDAELVADMMNEIWARLDVVIKEHGGRIDKHIGDAVMAVWGAEGAAEDDPERAVRTGLALQETLAAFADKAKVGMRVGISTGPALVGAVGTTSERTAMGDTVNLASRLEHHAPVNGVLISHDTYRTVRGIFDVRPAGKLSVRGKAAPVLAYIVERAKPRAFRVATRGVEGVETRMIDRDDEFAALREAYRDVQSRGPSRLVTVVADAGTGKSRLLYEFLNWIELEPSRAYLFTGRALANRHSAALGLFRDVMATRFDIHDSDSPVTVARKLRDGFAGPLAPSEADVVGYWLGFELPSDVAGRLQGSDFAVTARAHLFEYFGSMSAEQPLVLALEDLHWADVESLELVVDLLTALSEHHLLVVGLARPTLFDREPGWPHANTNATQLAVSPLSDASSRELVLEVLQRVDYVPDQLVELVASRADGNAFYIEELLKMLIDDGAIDTSAPDDWRIRLDRLDPSAVPSTLTGVLQARLDALAADERQTLQCASVIGRVFWDAAVAWLATDLASTDAALEVVRGRELVFLRPQSSFDSAEEYFFKHALLCDVTYETVLLRDRQPLHARAAAWLEASAGERVAEYREMIAAHHEAAGQLAEAADHLWRAGQTHATKGASAATRRTLDAAVGMWAAIGVEPPADAVLLLAEACIRLDDLATAEALLASTSSLPMSESNQAVMLSLSSWLASSRGQLELDRSLLDQALPLAEAAGGSVLVRVLTGLTWSEANFGRVDEAQHDAERALLIAEGGGDAGDVSRALGVAAMVAAERGDFVGSQALVERQLVVAEASGNLDQQSLAHDNLAVVIHLRGDAETDDSLYRAAIPHYERARALNRRLGKRSSEVRSSVNLAQIYIRLGRDADAADLIRTAMADAVTTGQPSIVSLCLSMEADRLLTVGDADRGLAYLGLILAQPYTGAFDRNEIDRVLSRTSLTPDAIERGMAAGAALDFDAVVQELLAETSADP
jgi:class 3 adenylate cyclase/tetratricopeptide (TPR) repeat protein